MTWSSEASVLTSAPARVHASSTERDLMAPIIKKTFLQAVRLEREKVASFEQYPFCIPAVRHLKRLEFHPAITFFIGENGTGKSTLLEAIATKYGFNAEGGSKNFNFATQDTHSDLHDFIRLERGVLHPSEDLESKRRRP